MEVGVEVAQVGLIPSFCGRFRWGVTTKKCFRGSIRVGKGVIEEDSLKSRDFSIIS